MNNPNAAKNLKSRKKGQPALPGAGRRPNVYQSLIDGHKLSKSDAQAIMSHMLSLPYAQLYEVIKNPETPIVFSAFAEAIMKDMARGDITAIEAVMNRAYGKPTETVETKDLNDVANMSLEEIQAEIARLEGKK